MEKTQGGGDGGGEGPARGCRSSPLRGHGARSRWWAGIMVGVTSGLTWVIGLKKELKDLPTDWIRGVREREVKCASGILC